jgi:ATP-dependent protease ClpP protease subunit
MFYLTPQEAKEYGLIDIVLNSSKDAAVAPVIAAGAGII